MEIRIEQGMLLASAPDMLDPNFMHSVVLVVAHTEEGAYGLVVNKESGHSLRDLAPEHPALGELDFPVHWGGPVGLETMQVVHRIPKRIPGGKEIAHGVYLGGELEAMAELIAADPVAARQQVRFLHGYSGWGEGQLDRELASESWLPAALDVERIFGDDQQRTWRRVVRSVGGQAAGFEDLPPDVRWN